MSARDQILGKIEPLEPIKHPGDFKGASEDFDFRTAFLFPPLACGCGHTHNRYGQKCSKWNHIRGL